MRSKSNRSPFHRIATTTLIIAVGVGLYTLGYRQGAHSETTIDSGFESHPKAEPDNSTLESPTPSQPKEPDPTPSPQRNRESPMAVNDEGIDFREIGYQAAKDNLDDALAQAASMNRREQAFFVAGLFKYIAENSSPRDALTIATAQAGTTRSFALKALVAEWAIDKNLPNDQQESRQRRVLGVSEGRFGLEAELASILARSSADPAINSAWMDAFSSHPGRSEIVARLSPSLPDFNPAKALARTEGWTDWERSRFTESLINNWSSQDPRGAWRWYSENPNDLHADAARNILSTWAQRDPTDMIQSLDTIANPEDRRLAIEAISASLATKGTDKALDWVESLATETEKDIGLQAVYQNTPKGIGAVLKTENGFPEIAEIMPSGALASTDLRAGDLIVQSRNSGEDPQDLYGKNLRDIVGILRGAPGSEVEIRVLRENEATGQLEEHSTTVVRDLLILESSDRK